MPGNVLSIQNLCKTYRTANGDVHALDHVGLNVKSGEFTAIVGRSGSGKTTLLNMIAGLDLPDSGSILFDGTDLVKLSAGRMAELRRRKIGVIYQFYNLIPELTLRENIVLPVELDGGEIDPEWLSEVLTVMGLAGREDSYPSMLSGGQQQRAAVARALFNRPSLILADEPTGNLDGESAAEVINLLKSMNTEYGVTVLIVTHSEDVARGAERVITISDGKIVGDRKW